MIRITPAREWEAEWLASYLRPEDVRECLAASGRKPEEVVPESLRLSKECYAVRRVIDGSVMLNPCALFGCCFDPSNPGWGLVWLLATPEMRLVARSFLKVVPSYLNRWSESFEYGLHTLVDSRNPVHVRWLQRVGFQIVDTYVHSDVPFFYTQRLYREGDKSCVMSQP